MFLCPMILITCCISLVIAYSIVAFQCRNVWKVIFLTLSFFSLAAILALCIRKYLAKCRCESPQSDE